MRRPEATEPSPLREGDRIVLNDGRLVEVVLVTSNRVLFCSTLATYPDVKAASWEEIDRVT